MTAHVWVEATRLHMCGWRIHDCTSVGGDYMIACVRVELLDRTCVGGAT